MEANHYSDKEVLDALNKSHAPKNAEFSNEEVMAAINEPSELEATIRGAGRGALMGVVDVPTIQAALANLVGSKKTKEQYMADMESAKTAHPEYFTGGELAGGIGTTALGTYLTGGFGGATLAARLAASGGVGAGLGYLQKADESLPIKDRAENAAIGLGTGLVGEGLASSVYPVARSAKEALKKGMATVSGIPKRSMDVLEGQYPAIQRMGETFGGNVAEAANSVREGYQKVIGKFKNEAASQLRAGISQLEDEKIHGEWILRDIKKTIKGLNLDSPKDSALAGDLRILKQEIEAVLTKKGNIKGQEIFNLYEKLKDYASDAYKSNGIFQSGDKASREANRLYKLLRDQIDELSPEIKAANQKYTKLHEIDDKINKNLINPNTPEAALVGAGGANEQNNIKLQKLDELIQDRYALGKGRFEREAERLAAMRYFYDPEIASLYSTGRSAIGGALGGLAGAGVGSASGDASKGATIGGLMGAGLSNPAGIKQAIKLFRAMPREQTFRKAVNPFTVGTGAGISAESLRRLQALEE